MASLKNATFNRLEQKYLVKLDVLEKFIAEIEPNLKKNKFFDYKIKNIYFDNDSFDSIAKSIAKPVYKEKMRLRMYGDDIQTCTCYLEIKKKFEQVVFKRRIPIPYSEIDNYENYVCSLTREDNFLKGQIADEIKHFLAYHKVVPRTYVSYQRKAYTDAFNSDIRITYDTNIRGRFENIKLEDSPNDVMIIGDDYGLLEIKATSNLPSYYTKALAKYKILKTSFSKYGVLYRLVYHKEREENV